jgi:tetratricopeptide (TPR) repeat protein
MALGFGFNKTKVLNAAEKFVQQGKLQSAISEYEKVIKEDPKDLTVLNAIGDLYHRVGQNDKAAEYFRKVGDQYAQNGFTVKAIAVYKKLTRVATSTDAALKLAELYTQQGLFNEAKNNYVQVAEQLLKARENEQAARVFQKILELDPENTTTQSKLADLYIKLGKKDEARKIYHNAAESLYARQAFDAADEALSRVLALDSEDKKALLLRGLIAADSGDLASTVQYLEQVPDLESRPEAMRALLNAKLRTGAMKGLEPLAVKMLEAHQDVTGLAALAEWQAAHHQEEEALKLYDQYGDKFFAQAPSTFAGTIYPLISRIGDNPEALERMLRLLQRAGDTSHRSEVMELLAHAKVQIGDFEVARDLYQELAELEPENPLHAQNHRQMLARLGEDVMSRPLSTEESSQAFMVEELEHSAPTVPQEYDTTVEKAIEAALTDAELFISYNVPLKAIAPLEAVLPVAPRDLRLNQRLASLYLRAGRYTDTVNTCKLLSDLYAEFGHPADSQRYADEARKYSSRAAQEHPSPATPPALSPTPQSPVVTETEAAASPTQTSTVKEFVLDGPEEFFESPAPAQQAVFAEEAEESTKSTVTEFPVETAPEPVAETASPVEEPQEIEIDVSHEWESMLTVEPEPQVEEVPQPAAIPEPVIPEPEDAVAANEPISPPPDQIEASPEAISLTLEPATPDLAVVEDKIQEIRFYISQSFWDMAQAAMHDLSEIDPENLALDELRAAISAGEAQASASAQAPPVPVHTVAPIVPPPPVPAHTVAPIVPPPPAPAHTVAPIVPPPPVPARTVAPIVPPPPAPAHTVAPIVPPPPVPARTVAPIVPPPPVPARTVAPIVPPPPAPAHTVAPIVPPPPVPAHTVAPIVPPPPAPVRAVAPTAPPEVIPVPWSAPSPITSKPLPPPVAPSDDEEFVLDLEDEPAPAAKAAPEFTAGIASKAADEPARLSKAQVKKPEEDVLGEFVSDLEQSLGDFVPESEPEREPALPAAGPTNTTELGDVSPVIQAAASAPSNGGMQNPEATSVLSNILSELREDLEQDLEQDIAATEDPETHYNLGIAFKEMGLLDEAIGELQKVCHMVEVGNSFSQSVQAYTWLAQCLVDKGVPEAAVRWYQKALQLPGLDHTSRCAIYYDLGSAYEASGDKKSALANFMEVYSSNIDFRDVANRIKFLKSPV